MVKSEEELLHNREITMAEAVVALVYFETIRDQLKSGAVSYETRKSVEETRLTENQLKFLVKMGWAEKTNDDKYYAICKDGKHC
jgi:hypothetical protein